MAARLGEISQNLRTTLAHSKAALNLDGKLPGVGMTISGVIEDGMAQMSEKFVKMSGSVYLDAEKVKESNKVL